MKLLFLTCCFIGVGHAFVFGSDKIEPQSPSGKDLPRIEKRSDFQNKMYDFKSSGSREFTTKSSRPKLASEFSQTSSLSPGTKASGFDKKVPMKEFSTDKSFPVGESSMAARQQKFFKIQERFKASSSSRFSPKERAREQDRVSRLSGQRYQGPEAAGTRPDSQQDRVLLTSQLNDGPLSIQEIREILNKE